MIDIDNIIELINDGLKTHYFKDITLNGIAEIVVKNDRNTPCKYIGGGEYVPLLEDTKGLTIYHRIDGEVTIVEDEEAGFGRNPLTTLTYPIKTIFHGNQDSIKKEVKDINLLLANEFKSLIPRKLSIEKQRTIVNITSINHDREELSEDEGLENTPENIFFAINSDIVIVTTQNCNDLSCETT